LRWFLRSYSKAGKAAVRIRRLASESACDVLILYGRSFFRLWPMIQAAHRSGQPVLWDSTEGHLNFSGFLGPLNPIFWDWRLASMLLPKYMDAATAICEPLKEILQKRGLSRVLIVPHIEEFSQLPRVTAGNPCGEFNLLYVGALLPRDNPSMMLQILRKLMDRSLPVWLWIAGKYEQVGEGREMQRWIEQEPELSQHVKFLGMLSDEQLAQVRDQTQGLILLRRNSQAEKESFPTRLIEGLKAGKPVFVSDVGDIRVYLQNELHAILLPPDDPEKAAQAIARVIQSEDRGFQIGLNGQTQAAQCFNRAVHARRIIEFVTPLVRSHEGASR